MNRNFVCAFSALSFFLVCSCGSGTYQSETFFENRTGHRITIEPYGNKILFKEGVRSLAINEVKLVDQNTGRGVGGALYATFAGDSIVVTFDDTLKISHLGLNKTPYPKSYAYEHPRNLRNRSNYTEKISESGKFMEREYRYIFTREDYQDALLLNKK